MRLMQLIYGSTPFGFDQATLNRILVSARRHNRQDGITGALICRADLFLQMLEGPRDKVTAAFTRIAQDDRHLDVRLIWSGDAEERLFPDWDMLDDPARSWMWSQSQVDAGAIDNSAMEEARSIFARLAKEVARKD
jgi:hypothetical protein